MKLCGAIKLGDFTQVRNLVDGINDVNVVRDIEAKVWERWRKRERERQ